MKFAFCVFVLLFVLQFNYSDEDTLTIGALFHEDEDDLRMIFEEAIKRRNIYKHGIKFNTTIETVMRSDTFSTQKIICQWLKSGNGLVGIFGPSSTKTSCMAQSIAETLLIPHIQIHWKTSKIDLESQQMTVNYYPDQNTLAMGIATVVRHLEWKTYVILYENQESLVRLQEVLKVTDKNNDPVTVRQLEGPDYRPIFKTFKKKMVYHFIIDCSMEVLEQTLKHAAELGFLDYVYSYFLTNLDAHTMDISSFNTKANITTVRIIDPESRPVQTIVHDWEMTKDVYIAPNKVKVAQALMDDAVSHFTKVVSELNEQIPIRTRSINFDEKDYHDKWEMGTNISSVMRSRNIFEGTTGNISFDQLSGRRTTFTLEVIEFVHGIPEKSCEWYPVPHLMFSLNCTRTEGKKMQAILENLQKEVVIVSSRIGQPYLVHNDPSSPGEVLTGNARYRGYSMDLIDAIAKILNFTYEFQLAKDNAYGTYRKELKSWDGLIKDLLDRRAHLAICDLTITHDRRAVVDFSMQFMSLGIGILYRKAKESETALFAFMDPLETEVWLYIVTFYISVTVAMYLITRMAPGDWENPHPCDQNPKELENIWTLKNCMWLILGSTMSQGCDILPKGISSRMASSMWWFLILIINSSYTANLAAFLTKDRMGATIDSADSLAAQTRVKYGTVEGGSTQAFFRDHKNNKVYQKMWTVMSQAKPSVFEDSNQNGVKRVLNTKNQGFAFLMESSQIEFEIERNCDLIQVGTRLDNKGYGIAMPMNSPYRSAINKAVLKLQEDGTLNKLKIKWWKKELGAGKCDTEVAPTGTAAMAWNISNVAGVFIVLAVGVGIAFVFAICEFLWNVREISIQEHISFYHAFKIEFKFAINIWVTEKRVKPEIPEPREKDSEERSIAMKVLHGAGSFLQLDVFDKFK